MNESPKAHWDRVYGRKGPEQLSWFQPSLRMSLRLIDSAGLPTDARIIDVGGGASTLVDDLIERGFRDITVLDISSTALDVTRRRLGQRAAGVTWIEGDATTAHLPAGHYDLWHDRAVFHFLTDPEARRRYVALARRALKPGGNIIIATFAAHGPQECSGLDVVRYDEAKLHEEFGAPFAWIECEEEMHRTPSGREQAFIYCRGQLTR